MIIILSELNIYDTFVFAWTLQTKMCISVVYILITCLFLLLWKEETQKKHKMFTSRFRFHSPQVFVGKSRIGQKEEGYKIRYKNRRSLKPPEIWKCSFRLKLRSNGVMHNGIKCQELWNEWSVFKTITDQLDQSPL